MVRIRTQEGPELSTLHRRMEQVMERLLRDLSAPASAAAWMPRVDLYDTESAIAAILEIPGVDRDRIEIVVEGQFLRISGERPEPQTAACTRWHQMEIVRGPFERVLALPYEVDASAIAATYRGGFLLITMPRAATLSRSVPIEPR